MTAPLALPRILASKAKQPDSDLPPHILKLARMLARECCTPGRYHIDLTISSYPASQPHKASVKRVETIREMEMPKRE